MYCSGGDPKVIINDQSLACRLALLASLRVELTSLRTVQNRANCDQLENFARVVTLSFVLIDFPPKTACLHANLFGI